MKLPTSKLLAVLVVLSLFVALVSGGCTGPQGPEGPAGPEGQEGPEGQSGAIRGLVVAPADTYVGGTIRILGSGFSPSVDIVLAISDIQLTQVTTDQNGAFDVSATVPSLPLGVATVEAVVNNVTEASSPVVISSNVTGISREEAIRLASERVQTDGVMSLDDRNTAVVEGATYWYVSFPLASQDVLGGEPNVFVDKFSGEIIMIYYTQ